MHLNVATAIADFGKHVLTPLYSFIPRLRFGLVFHDFEQENEFARTWLGVPLKTLCRSGANFAHSHDSNNKLNNRRLSCASFGF